MKINGLQSFVVGLIWLGIGGLLFLDGFKSPMTVIGETISVSLLGGIAMLLCGSAFLLNGFYTNAIRSSEA